VYPSACGIIKCKTKLWWGRHVQHQKRSRVREIPNWIITVASIMGTTPIECTFESVIYTNIWTFNPQFSMMKIEYDIERWHTWVLVVIIIQISCGFLLVSIGSVNGQHAHIECGTNVAHGFEPVRVKLKT
jgi:hypothetical protein